MPLSSVASLSNLGNPDNLNANLANANAAAPQVPVAVVAPNANANASTAAAAALAPAALAPVAADGNNGAAAASVPAPLRVAAAVRAAGSNASGPITGTNGSSVASSEMGYTLPSEGASSSEAAIENNIGDLDTFIAESREGERREALTPGARKFAKSAQDNKERNSEKNKIVEIDVPMPQSSIFKTYQVPFNQFPKDLKIVTATMAVPRESSDPVKLLGGRINKIYETYIQQKMNESKEGERYVRITYLGKDYLVRMQPMDNISEIKKAIEKQDKNNVEHGHKAFNKLSSVATGKPTTPFPDVKGMSFIQLALKKQELEQNGATANNGRLQAIEQQLKDSIEFMNDEKFAREYMQKQVAARSGSNENIDNLKLYHKESLLRAEEKRTSAISAAALSLKDLPVELERIERNYIRAGRKLNDLHTDKTDPEADPEAEKYQALRDRFKIELAKNSERWGWWKDWKDPKYNRYRTGGKQTAKKSKKNNKTKKSTQRSS